MECTLALAQVNPHVGALAYNVDLMIRTARLAKERGADLVLFPELSLTGYPPEDLLHKPLFLKCLKESEQQLHQGFFEIGIDAVYGSVRLVSGSNTNRPKLYNAGVFVQDGKEVGFAAKWHLPNYGVFDEQRYFVPGHTVEVFSCRGIRFGITICEDLWHVDGPLQPLKANNAALILNLNASPYHMGKPKQRQQVIGERILEQGLPVLYVNQVGGQDELVFDGGSFVKDHSGTLISRSPCFIEDLSIINIHQEENGLALVQAGVVEPEMEFYREVYSALCLGLKDYVRKNGFSGVVLGLSGGIDSALTAVICADALGAQQVEALMMPSGYTASHSLEDAFGGAKAMGVRLTNIPIGGIFDRFLSHLAEEFQGLPEDVTEENIQPRIRATLLMAIANKKHKLLVTTGNKSEMSVGYATLYGDMAGGYSVLKDVLKGLVYGLSKARNQWALERGEPLPIPVRVIEKEPSAELKPNQKDSDSLPPYPLLDRILEMYVEKECSLQEIVEAGLDKKTAIQVIKWVDSNEYKRRQSPPGVRITSRAFGKDRRYPLTNGFTVS